MTAKMSETELRAKKRSLETLLSRERKRTAALETLIERVVEKIEGGVIDGEEIARLIDEAQGKEDAAEAAGLEACPSGVHVYGGCGCPAA